MKANVVVINRHGAETSASVFTFVDAKDLEFQVAEYANTLGYRRYEVEIDSSNIPSEVLDELEEHGFLIV